MIDIKEIQLKLDNILSDLNDALSQINEELNYKGQYFVQAKEIEKTIQKLEKNGVAVPDELIKLKTDLINKSAYFEELSKLKIETQNKIQEIIGFNNGLKKSRKNTHSKTNRSVIYSFTFLGESYPISSWKEFLITFVKILASKHSDFTTKAIEVKGKKRPYFTKNKNLLRVPVFIDEIGLYIESNLSSNQILKIVYTFLDIFGYKKQDLKVSTNDI